MPRRAPADSLTAPTMGALLRACREAAEPTAEERTARRSKGRADPPRGLTLAEVGARAGTSWSRLSTYEHDKTSPAWDTAHRIAAACGFDLVPVAKAKREG